jgi:creatinine amidohydrolase
MWNLAELSYSVVREQHYEVAVLPFGATEPHNLHLPYGTDCLEATTIARHVCDQAHREGAHVVLLPTIPYGTQTNMQAFPLAMNLNPSTLARVIADLVESLVNSGIHKVLLLNSHGGNTLKPVLRELAGVTPAHLFLCDWYHAIRDEYSSIFEKEDDHAGEMETSLALAYFGHLIARDEQGAMVADEGGCRTSRFEAINRGWVSISRPWHLLTTNSGAGDPRAATAEKGQRLMDLIVRRLSRFLVELSRSPLDEWFPFTGDDGGNSAGDARTERS